jgi:hypothetical protein
MKWMDAVDETAGKKQSRIGKTILRLLGGGITIAVGALMVFPGASILWVVLEAVIAPPGAVLYSYGIEVGGVTLKGWQVLAFAVLLIVMGIGLMGLGLSTFLRRKADR